jgi:hypothetical protein
MNVEVWLSAGHIVVPTIISNGPNGLADEQSLA